MKLPRVTGLLTLLISAPLAAEPPPVPPGKLLFEQHGSTNRHGPEGVHPSSKYAPVLRGKSADYLFENAVAIFAGDEKSGKTRFMHEQFCVGEAQEEGCYPPPDTPALRAIANWLGGDAALPEKKRTEPGLYVTAVDAYKRLQEAGDKAILIDIRTRAEVAFVGMPTIAAANIPYMTAGSFDEWDDKKQTFKLRPNSEFTLRVNELMSDKGLDKDTPIYLLCRSGSRSAKAANLLTQAGYSQVYSVTDGFEGDTAKEGPHKGERVVNGWKNAGLPWTYKLNKTAMYWDL